MIIELSLGVLAGIITIFFFGVSSNSIFVIICGALSAIAVDLDAIIYKFWYGHRFDQFAHEHRDLFHYPIIVCGLGSIVVAAIINVEFGFTWFLATLFHFVHDTLEGGWGIQWFFPFWNKYIALKQDEYSPKNIMNKEEQREIASRYGNPEWMSESLKTKRLLLEVAFLCFVILIAIIAIK